MFTSSHPSPWSPWNPEQPTDLYLAFAPNRTFVDQVRLGSTPLEPHTENTRAFWRVQRASFVADNLQLVIEWYGEEPSVLAAKSWPSDDNDAMANGMASMCEAVDMELVKLLKARAALKWYEYAKEREFFLRFDAWTQSDLCELLREAQFRQRIAGPAFDMFCSRLPAYGLDRGKIFDVVARHLHGCVLTRAQGCLKSGTGNGDLALPSSIVNDLTKLRTNYRDALDGISDYLFDIFELDFPRATQDGEVTADLERAFACFAAGHLGFVPLELETGVMSRLNAEPDSTYFFSFAEFAIQMCERDSNRPPIGPDSVRPNRSTYWFSLARLFVALEDVFCATYGPPLGPRSIPSYRRSRRPANLIALHQLENHVNRFRDEFSRVGELPRLIAAHTINAMHALREYVNK